MWDRGAQGWEVVREYHDAGISGAKGREARPSTWRSRKRCKSQESADVGRLLNKSGVFIR